MVVVIGIGQWKGRGFSTMKGGSRRATNFRNVRAVGCGVFVDERFCIIPYEGLYGRNVG